jgi:hypothetical protein
MSNHLTYTIDLDYLNVDNIQTYITFLQSLIENERRVEEERLNSRIKLTTSKQQRKLLSIVDEDDENDDKVETSDLETQADIEPLEAVVTNDLSTKTKAQLSELCKLKDIKHTSKTTKNKLIELLSV